MLFWQRSPERQPGVPAGVRGSDGYLYRHIYMFRNRATACRTHMALQDTLHAWTHDQHSQLPNLRMVGHCILCMQGLGAPPCVYAQKHGFETYTKAHVFGEHRDGFREIASDAWLRGLASDPDECEAMRAAVHMSFPRTGWDDAALADVMADLISLGDQRLFFNKKRIQSIRVRSERAPR